MDFASIPKKAQSVLAKPKDFFDSIKGEKGFNDALVYYAILSAVGAIPTLSFGIGNVVSMVVTGIIFSFVFAFIVQIFVSLFKGTGKFEGTYRALAYGYTPSFFSNFTVFIPVIGQILSLALLVYSIYLVSVGISKYHGISMGKSVASVLVPVIVVTVLVFFFFASLFMESMMRGIY